MTHQEIVNKVKSILNEHGGDDGLSIGTDRVLLDDYIKVAIPDAVTMLAVKGYAVNRALVGPFNDWEDVEHPGYVSLIRVECSGWNRIVTRVTEIGSPEYAMAQNEFTKPGINTPMVVMKYGYLTGMPIPEGGYSIVVEYNKAYDGQTLNAGEKEATAVCYMAAAIVLGLFGDDQGKQRLSDLSTNMLQ